MNQQNDNAQKAEELGERIAMLLNVSKLSDDVKAGLMAMIPKMNADQINRLVSALEGIAQETAGEQETELLAQIESAQKEYEVALGAAQDKAMQGLEEVESILKQAEG
jgi:hypothetical protein